MQFDHPRCQSRSSVAAESLKARGFYKSNCLKTKAKRHGDNDTTVLFDIERKNKQCSVCVGKTGWENLLILLVQRKVTFEVLYVNVQFEFI